MIQGMVFADIVSVTSAGVSARLSPEADDVSAPLAVAHGVPVVGGKCVVVQTHGTSYVIPVASVAPAAGGGVSVAGTQGPAGHDGAQGVPGHKGDKGDPGPAGHDGVQGPQGIQGLVGTGVHIKGTVATVAGLSTVTDAKDGDVHFVAGDGDLHVFHDPCDMHMPVVTEGLAGARFRPGTTHTEAGGVSTFTSAGGAMEGVLVQHAVVPGNDVSYSMEVRIVGAPKDMTRHQVDFSAGGHSWGLNQLTPDGAWHSVTGTEHVPDAQTLMEFRILWDGPSPYKIEVRGFKYTVGVMPAGVIRSGTGCWTDVGHVQGPQGPPGIQGPKGDPGADGHDGAQGVPGHAGSDGTNGADGHSIKVTKSHTAPAAPGMGDVWIQP